MIGMKNSTMDVAEEVAKYAGTGSGEPAMAGAR